MTDKKTITLNNLKLLRTNSWGYHGSGVAPYSESFFFKAEDNGQVYTISTTKPLAEGDVITASVKGTRCFNGEIQINLNRVKVVRPAGNSIDTDGKIAC